MTAKEERMYRNVAKWRSLPQSKRQSILRTSNIEHVVNSMAMEGEPVSKQWLKKNAR